MSLHSNKESFFSKTRVEAFSDGVFAIIVTLLVFEIQLPALADHNSKQDLLNALWQLFPKVLSWIISFLILCVIWVNHHRIFEQLKVVTYRIFWLNANLLLWCSFIPFPTAVMGDYINNPVSLILFGVILAMMSFSFSLMRFSILKNSFMLNDDVDVVQYKKVAQRSLFFGPCLYLLGALLSLVHTSLALIIYFLIPFYFIFFNTSKTKQQSL